MVEGASLIIILELLLLTCCFTHLQEKQHVKLKLDELLRLIALNCLCLSSVQCEPTMAEQL